MDSTTVAVMLALTSVLMTLSLSASQWHKRKFAALCHQWRDAVRRCGCFYRSATPYTQRLDRHQRQHAGGDERPVSGHHLQIQRHVDAEKEQRQQQATKRFYGGLQMGADTSGPVMQRGR